MSRAGAGGAGPATSTATPLWVWIVYALGILGAVVLIGSAAVSAVLVVVSDASIRISPVGLVVSLVLVVAAVAVKLQRRAGARA